MGLSGMVFRRRICCTKTSDGVFAVPKRPMAIAVLVNSDMLDLIASRMRDVFDCTVAPPYSILIPVAPRAEASLFPGVTDKVLEQLRILFPGSEASFSAHIAGDLHMNVCRTTEYGFGPVVFFCAQRTGSAYEMKELASTNGRHIALAVKTWLERIPGIPTTGRVPMRAIRCL